MKLDRVAIVGATSMIAGETARCLAARGARLTLVGRNSERLEALGADLRVRGAVEVKTRAYDLQQRKGLAKLADELWLDFTGLDSVLFAHGELGNHGEALADPDEAARVFEINLVSTIGLLTVFANRFECQGTGLIAVIGSVAGDRGRPSNYVYGTSKGALALFCEGLRARLARKGVTVLLVKPGFVDTPMTDGMEKNFLFASPERVGRGIFRAMERGREEVYLPWFWRWIMLVIRLLPRWVFKRIEL